MPWRDPQAELFDKDFEVLIERVDLFRVFVTHTATGRVFSGEGSHAPLVVQGIYNMAKLELKDYYKEQI